MTTATRGKSPGGPSLFARIGPGILLAATGVGTGDLATASFTGSQLGVAVLWAVLLGAFFKFVLTEGIARWQLATGETMIEGVTHRFGRLPVALVFLPYLIVWSYFVGAALISATGVALHAMFPIFDDPIRAKIVFGILASVASMLMVLAGGFRLFERVMAVCVGLMFATVVLAVGFLWPGTGEVVRGLVVPIIPDAGGSGATWTIALIGGVGGTVTMLCYGYWIREKGWSGAADLRKSRVDLGAGYGMTAIFGCAMVIIGSAVVVEGSGAQLLVVLANKLEESMGPVGRWLFLLGAFGAIFSSMLGVWQSVPYIFADLWQNVFGSGGAQGTRAMSGTTSESAVPGESTVAAGRSAHPTVDVSARPYRLYLLGLTVVPMLGLFTNFREIQKAYSVVGAGFLPLLAIGLLLLNGRRKWMGPLVNSWRSVLVLLATLLFFGVIGWASGGG